MNKKIFTKSLTLTSLFLLGCNPSQQETNVSNNNDIKKPFEQVISRKKLDNLAYTLYHSLPITNLVKVDGLEHGLIYRSKSINIGDNNFEIEGNRITMSEGVQDKGSLVFSIRNNPDEDSLVLYVSYMNFGCSSITNNAQILESYFPFLQEELSEEKFELLRNGNGYNLSDPICYKILTKFK